MEAFLAVAKDFQFGNLPTEQIHPDTGPLSELATSDAVPDALRLLQRADVDAIRALQRDTVLREIEILAARIHSVLEAGGRIFMTGCGASGRVAVSLGIFGRKGYLGPTPAFRSHASLCGFMAGGDIAFIRAVEQFEDQKEYGARQLCDEGFRQGDLLIAFSAAGAAPYVVGACEAAVKLSTQQVVLVLCNDVASLAAASPRSKELLESVRVSAVSLVVGPMAVSGSTRMQAATAQLLAVGLALSHHDKIQAIRPEIETLHRHLQAMDYGCLADFTALEASLYRERRLFLYEAGSECMASVLTDVTERAPTFSLAPFERLNGDVAQLPSTLYMHVAASGALRAWESLLERPPEPLEWSDDEEVLAKAGLRAFQEYDMSDTMFLKRYPRQDSWPWIRITCERGRATFLAQPGRDGAALSRQIDTGCSSPFLYNVLLKCLLNAHSTAVMANLGRVHGNVMVFVRPSNNKLIDRVIRYCSAILMQQSVSPLPSYRDVAETVFRLRGTIGAEDSIVLAVVSFYTGTSRRL